MKTINVFTRAVLSVAVLGLIFTGCKKDGSMTDPQSTDVITQQMQNASDEGRVSSESDNVADEANSIALNFPHFRGINYQGIITGTFVPCNATIDSSMVAQGKLTVNYHGLSCDNRRYRTGSITLQLPYNTSMMTVTPWSAAGSVLTITFNSYDVRWVIDNKSLTFNGSKTITNVNGGLIDNSVTFTTPIVHNVAGMMQIMFDNGATRTWNISRTRTIARNNNITTITTIGTGTQNGFTNVSIWGINRVGNIFTLSITTPVVVSSACNYDAISGVRVHHGVIRELTVTYGVDQNGNPGVSLGCPYGYKLNWVNADGVPKQVVIPY